MSAAATGAADLRAELAALRKRAADTPALPEGPAAAAAAVLAFFDPFALPGLGEAGPDDPGLDAIMGLSEPVSDPPGFWTLGLHARRALLARLGSREAVRIALESVPDRPEVAAQLGFELIAQGPEAVRSALEGASLKRVAGLSIARTWVEGVAALEEGMPGADEIASALADLRRRAPLRELVGDHFTGRDSILSRMRAHLSPDAPSEVLFIHGPGGVGKSTVLAKFSLEIEESGVADAIVYLNLDRPLLRPGEPLTLLQDLLAQLAQQFGEHAGVLEEAAGRVAATAERFDRAFKAGSGLESMSVSGFWETMIGDAAETISALPGDGPLLVMIDTFEQAQRLGPGIVEQMWFMFRLLAERQPRLRIIAAGRVEDDMESMEALSLEAFERSDVQRVLERTVGADVPDAIVDDVFAASEGHPLTVRLAALAVKGAGIRAFLDPRRRAEELERLRDERRDALLYGRILRQIADPTVAELAVPGLVMRRITAAAIDEVLAVPCGLTITPAEAQDLFERFRREVDLVTLDTNDPNAPALVHRPEVRAMMLDDLRRDRPEQARMIDERAAAFFSQMPGPFARAEYIYHLLFLGAEPDMLDALWNPDLAAHLATAVDEVPPRGAAWLAKRIGMDLSPEAAAAIELEEWEEMTRLAVEQRIGRGQFDMALKLLNGREARSPASPLWALEVQVWAELAPPEVALRIAARGIEALRRSLAHTPLANLLLTRGLLREKLRRFAQASKDAAEALKVAQAVLDGVELQLRAIAALLRLQRKSRNTLGPDRPTLLERVQMLLVKDREKLLSQNVSLARELAAELGEEYPELVEIAASQPATPVPLQDTKAGEAIGEAVLDRIGEAVKGDFGGLVNTKTKRAVSALQQRLPDVINLARDRNALDKVTKPISMLLAAEVDQRIGAFPSASMLARKTGLKLRR